VDQSKSSEKKNMRPVAKQDMYKVVDPDKLCVNLKHATCLVIDVTFNKLVLQCETGALA